MIGTGRRSHFGGFVPGWCSPKIKISNKSMERLIKINYQGIKVVLKSKLSWAAMPRIKVLV